MCSQAELNDYRKCLEAKRLAEKKLLLTITQKLKESDAVVVDFNPPPEKDFSSSLGFVVFKVIDNGDTYVMIKARKSGQNRGIGWPPEISIYWWTSETRGVVLYGPKDLFTFNYVCPAAASNKTNLELEQTGGIEGFTTPVLESRGATPEELTEITNKIISGQTNRELTENAARFLENNRYGIRREGPSLLLLS